MSEKRALSRRDFLRLTVAAAAGAAMAACAPAAPQVVEVEKEVPVEKVVKETVIVEKEVVVEKPAKPEEAVELYVWIQGDPQDESGWIKVKHTIIDMFKEEHPNITFKLEGCTERIDEKVLLTVKAGYPADLTMFSSQMLESHVAANTLIPLDDYMAAADQDWVSDLFRIEKINNTSRRTGKRYGVLNSVHSRVIYYRKDLLPGAPETWDDMVKYGMENTDESAGIWGYVFLGASPWNVEVEYGPFIWEQGEAVCDEGGMATWANPAAEKAIVWHRDAIYEHKFASMANVTGSFGDMWKMFLTGQAAMGVQGTYAFPEIQQRSGKELWDAGKIWAAPIPTPTADAPSKNFANGWDWGIPVGSAHPDEAFEFISFWGGPKTQVLHSKEEGGAPIVKSAWEELYTEPIIFDVFFPNLDQNGRPMDPFVFYMEGLTALGKSIEESTTNPDADIMGILENSQEEFNKKYYTETGELKEIPGA